MGLIIFILIMALFIALLSRDWREGAGAILSAAIIFVIWSLGSFLGLH
jgi:hypothetical protein